MRYAGFWKRLIAAIIDGVILTIIAQIVFTVVFNVNIESLETDNPALLGKINIMSIIFGWLYFALMESSPKQGTLGKMALGIKVTDLNGNKIDFGRATGRHFSKFISAIILFIGFLMIAFTSKKQGLHDIIAGCLVVNK